jgi:hypothetical protein
MRTIKSDIKRKENITFSTFMKKSCVVHRKAPEASNVPLFTLEKQ